MSMFKNYTEDEMKDILDLQFEKEYREEMLAKLPKESLITKLKGLWNALFGVIDLQ